MTDNWKNKSNIYIDRFDLPYPKNQKLAPGGNADTNCRDKGKSFINQSLLTYGCDTRIGPKLREPIKLAPILK